MHAVDALPPSIPAGVNPDSYLRKYPDPKPEALRRLSRLMADFPAQIHVEDGPATQAILSIAEREDCDLIVLGEGRERLIGPLEPTLDGVVRKAPTSVLVVRNRPASLIDNSSSELITRRSVASACSGGVLFPDAELKLLHAYVAPYAGLRDATHPDSKWSTQELRSCGPMSRQQNLRSSARSPTTPGGARPTCVGAAAMSPGILHRPHRDRGTPAWILVRHRDG